jgi:hypothetical protein
MKPNATGNDASSSGNGNRKEKSKTAPKALNVDALDQSLWLVKVPQFVAERWATAQTDDVIGSLSVSLKATGPNRPPAKQLNVQLTPTSGASGPDKFTLEESKASTDTFIAVSLEQNKGFTVDGKVTKSMVLKPQINEEYRQLVRDRGLLNVTNRKEIGVANMKEIQNTSTQSHTVEFLTSDRMEMKRKAAAEKLLASKASRASLSGATAEDGDVTAMLRSRVFEAFEKNDRLTFKDILSYCSDVAGFTREQDLRDLLEEYGKYNHRGTYKHFWELKPEYKDNYTEAKVDG